MQDIKNKEKTTRIIGLMSGSSLDGLDMVCCDLTCDETGRWTYVILHADCLAYDAEFVARLRDAHHADGRALWKLHVDFGRLCGRAVRDFIARNYIQDVDYIGSHGHTVFHAPTEQFTTQIGDGAAMAYEAAVPVVCDFRSADLAKSGQGAPLVPMGDKLLWGHYPFLLNLGGIANITIQDSDQSIAFDIVCANQILNPFAQELGADYDDKGAWAQNGTLHPDLFDALNALDFYQQAAPKSLDNGYSRDVMLPIFARYAITPQDKLHTACEHIAFQIARALKPYQDTHKGVMLSTGGGALNDYLMMRVKHYTQLDMMQSDPTLVSYKEALVFALLAALRVNQEVNVLASVTGAKANSIGGAIYLP
jgi:anhydro-N-acetylmuramic acid kinase